jgi:hypothetical protein
MHLNPVMAKPSGKYSFSGITNASGLSVGYLKNKQKQTKLLVSPKASQRERIRDAEQRKKGRTLTER